MFILKLLLSVAAWLLALFAASMLAPTFGMKAILVGVVVVLGALAARGLWRLAAEELAIHRVLTADPRTISSPDR